MVSSINFTSFHIGLGGRNVRADCCVWFGGKFGEEMIEFAFGIRRCACFRVVAIRGEW